MRLLLDTHIFLWYILGDSKLPAAARDAIEDVNNQTVLSVVSVWEAVIKYGSGKLPLPESPALYLPQLRRTHAIATLPVDEGAMRRLAVLPSIHGDPFDRLLIAQALQHDLTLVTADAAVRKYPVRLL